MNDEKIVESLDRLTEGVEKLSANVEIVRGEVQGLRLADAQRATQLGELFSRVGALESGSASLRLPSFRVPVFEQAEQAEHAASSMVHASIHATRRARNENRLLTFLAVVIVPIVTAWLLGRH
jgi:hypothetical protein